MEQITGSKSLTVAAVVSLIIHGGIFLAYAVMFKDAGRHNTSDILQVALILPAELAKQAPIPLALSVKEKKGSANEDPGKTVIADDLTRSLEAAPPQAGKETPAAAPGNNQEMRNLAMISRTDQHERPATEASSAVGGISASAPATGKTSGKGIENGINNLGNQDVVASRGAADLSGYAQLETSRGAGFTSAVPRYRENYLPDYPLPARRRGHAGVVMLSVEVLADGSVGRLEMKKTSGYALLDKSAQDTVKNWKFSPAKKMGTPVTMWVDVPVKFELN